MCICKLSYVFKYKILKREITMGKNFCYIIIAIMYLSNNFLVWCSPTKPRPFVIKKVIPLRRGDYQLANEESDKNYEDDINWQSETEESGPYIAPIASMHSPAEFIGDYATPYNSYSYQHKRVGQKMFGDDFALFLVLLTIAGFFGLIMYDIFKNKIINLITYSF